MLAAVVALAAVAGPAFAGGYGESRVGFPLALSPDGSRLAFAGVDRGSPVQLFESASGRQVATLGGFRGAVQSLSFNSSGTLLAAGTMEAVEPTRGQILVFDVAHGELLTSAGTPALAWVDFGEDPNTVFFHEFETVFRIDLSAATPAKAPVGSGWERSSYRTHGSGRVASHSAATGLVARWTNGTDEVRVFRDGQDALLWSAPAGGSRPTFAFDPTGAVLYLLVAEGGQSRRLEIRDSATGAVARTLRLDFPGYDFEVSRDGRVLAMADELGRASVWDLASGTLRATFSALGPAARLTAALRARNFDAARAIVASGLDPNAMDENHRWPPVAWALSCDAPDVAELLLDAGADVNKVVDDPEEWLNGHNAVFVCIYSDRGPDMLRALIARGANLRAVNPRGETALVFARRYQKAWAVQVLLEAQGEAR
jgi:hypothetical protein